MSVSWGLVQLSVFSQGEPLKHLPLAPQCLRQREREKPGSRAQTDGTWQLLEAMRKLPTPGTNR